MEIVLQPNKGPNQNEVPYLAKIELFTMTVDAGSTFSVPIYAKDIGGEIVYDIEICGFRMETTELDDVPLLAESLIDGLVNMTRLPSYVFIARRSRGVYPVYTVENEVLATTPGGPTFRHVELAKVREYLSDYLHAVEVLGTPGKSDKLHVRGINGTDLSLIRPVFYLKKRIPGETDFWAPVFRSDDGKRIYTYAASARREVAVDGGKEILKLHKMVAEALIADKRLKNPYDLRPDRLFPGHLEQFRSILKPESELKVGDFKIPVYTYEGYFVGVEDKPDEDRHGLFLGESIDTVRRAVVRSFTRRKLIHESASVSVVSD